MKLRAALESGDGMDDYVADGHNHCFGKRWDAIIVM
jgi:hypothetical protein